MPECCLCVTVKSVSFALFSAGSQWTAGLEEPQHRQSSSPSLSSHSWNPLLLNNELNLSLASRGGLRTTLSLAEGFVAHVHVRTHTDVHTPARSYCHSLLPQVAVWKLLHWLAAEQKKTEGSAESGLWWRRKIGRRYEGGRGVCVCVSWRSTIAVSERFRPPVPLRVRVKCCYWGTGRWIGKGGAAVVWWWGHRGRDERDSRWVPS